MYHSAPLFKLLKALGIKSSKGLAYVHGAYTAPIAGHYMVSFGSGSLHVNGMTVAVVINSPSVSANTISYAISQHIVSCNKGDVISGPIQQVLKIY